MKALRCLYLYADGHAVAVYAKTFREVGQVEFTEITEQWTKARCHFTGRLVLGRSGSAGLAELMRSAQAIVVQAPSLERGSQATKERGIRVGSLELIMPKGQSLYWHDLSQVISCPWTYQPDCVEAFDPNLREWADKKVHRIHRIKAPAPESVGAA